MSTVTTENKTVAVPRKRAAKPQTAAVAAPETAAVETVDSSVYVAPTAVADGFVSNGSVPLDRLTTRALENLTELATEANTETARKYWTNRLAAYGVKVVPVVVPADEPVSA